MTKRNVITNLSLEQYNKKYRNRGYRLLKYSKKEVEEFDRLNKPDVKHYLLGDRKWVLIKDTYFEIPKAPRLSWFRNLNTACQVGTCLLGAGVIGAAVAVPTVLILNKGGSVTPTFDGKVTSVEWNDAIDTLTNVLKRNYTCSYEMIGGERSDSAEYYEDGFKEKSVTNYKLNTSNDEDLIYKCKINDKYFKYEDSEWKELKSRSACFEIDAQLANLNIKNLNDFKDHIDDFTFKNGCYSTILKEQVNGGDDYKIEIKFSNTKTIESFKFTPVIEADVEEYYLFKFSKYGSTSFEFPPLPQEEPEYLKYLDFTLDNDSGTLTATIKTGAELSENFVIPDDVDGKWLTEIGGVAGTKYPVTNIGKDVLKGDDTVSSVTVGNNVNSIEEGFCFGSSVESIYMPVGQWNFGGQILNVTDPQAQASSIAVEFDDGKYNKKGYDSPEFASYLQFDLDADGEVTVTLKANPINDTIDIPDVVSGDIIEVGEGAESGKQYKVTKMISFDDKGEKVTKITIGNNLITIPAGAFTTCDSLTDVIFKDTTSKWYIDDKGTLTEIKDDLTDTSANAEKFKANGKWNKLIITKQGESEEQKFYSIYKTYSDKFQLSTDKYENGITTEPTTKINSISYDRNGDTKVRDAKLTTESSGDILIGGGEFIYPRDGSEGGIISKINKLKATKTIKFIFGNDYVGFSADSEKYIFNSNGYITSCYFNNTQYTIKYNAAITSTTVILENDRKAYTNKTAKTFNPSSDYSFCLDIVEGAPVNKFEFTEGILFDDKDVVVLVDDKEVPCTISTKGSITTVTLDKDVESKDSHIYLFCLTSKEMESPISAGYVTATYAETGTWKSIDADTFDKAIMGDSKVKFNKSTLEYGLSQMTSFNYKGQQPMAPLEYIETIDYRIDTEGNRKAILIPKNGQQLFTEEYDCSINGIDTVAYATMLKDTTVKYYCNDIGLYKAVDSADQEILLIDSTNGIVMFNKFASDTIVEFGEDTPSSPAYNDAILQDALRTTEAKDFKNKDQYVVRLQLSKGVAITGFRINVNGVTGYDIEKLADSFELRINNNLMTKGTDWDITKEGESKYISFNKDKKEISSCSISFKFITDCTTVVFEYLK